MIFFELQTQQNLSINSDLKTDLIRNFVHNKEIIFYMMN